jgi:hypothetical protein
MMVQIRLVSGKAKVSIPVQWKIKKPGQRRTTLKNPTRPKKRDMSTLDSSPTCFFITMV